MSLLKIEKTLEQEETSVVVSYYVDDQIHENKSLFDEKELQYPEGGLQAYLTLLASFLGLCASFGLWNSMGAIESYVSAHILQDYPNQAAVSMIFSLFSFITMGFSMISGILFDKYGARIICICGTVFFVGGLMATANCTELYQFILAFGICTSIGCAMLMPPLVNNIGHFFNKKRGMAMAISMPGASLGGVIWPQVCRKLYDQVGFPWTMRILGFSMGGLLVITCLLISDRHEEMSCDIDEDLSFWKKVSQFVDFSCVKDKTFMILTAALFMNEFSLIMVGTYIPSYALSKGFSQAMSLNALTIYNASGILGRMIPTYLADRYGHYRMITIQSAIMTGSIFVIWLPLGKFLPAFLIFTIVFGFAVAGTLAITPMLTAAISKPKDFGRRYGTAYLFVSCCNLISLPVGRAITETKGGYNAMASFAGATSFMGTILFVWAAHQYKKNFMNIASKEGEEELVNIATIDTSSFKRAL